MQVQHFTWKDLDKFEISSEFKEYLSINRDKLQGKCGLLTHEAAVVVFGVININPTNGYVFMLTNDQEIKKPLLFTKTIKRYIQKAINDYSLQRVQALCLKGRDAKFLKVLGFQREGTLRQYQDGKDYEVYACLA